MSITTTWAKDRPYYLLGRDGEPHRRGDFTTGRPILSWIYGVLTESRLLRLLKIDLPPRFTDKHVELTARLIEKSARLYGEQFPRGRFVAVLHPTSLQYGTRLLRRLQAMKLEVHDYRGLFDPSRPENVLSADDLHPSALANAELAERIVRDLDLQ
jgi:hypothetical protein